MTNIDIMNYWIESSNKDYETLVYLKKGHKNTWCLFMGHLVVEKLLKALYAKNNPAAPYAPKSHDLLYLAQKLNLNLTHELKEYLDDLTKFNLNARYDDYKKNFYNRCSDSFTNEQVKKIKEVKKWLETLLQT